MSFERVCLIGFGEVGQILAADLAKAGVGDIAAFDVKFADPESALSRAAKAAPVRVAKSAIEAAAGAEAIFCAVTAAADVDAARSVAEGIGKGCFYLDLNSVSPGMKQEAAVVIDGAGGAYVEAAVMAAIGPKRLASPMLLGGSHAEAFLARAKPLGVDMKVVSPRVGVASATKMCRSVIIKGVESLLTESMISARRYGVEKEVLGSLNDMLPVGDWEKVAQYMISRSLLHGVRRAEEMREVARTVREAGVEPLMSASCAERQDWAALHKGALNDDLYVMLDALIAEIDGKKAT
jgi:3-hydroxyisobutyrate dehydrogenase-like beta-hydroxyacid dehydrogenase